MLFELKSVFQNEGEEKQVNYKLDIADIDIDGVFPFRTPIDVTATAKNRASLVSLTIRACFSYSRSCDRCSTDFTREMDMLFEHKLAQTLVDDGNDDYIETPDFKLEGWCQICGKNLNEGDCSCDKRVIDPRLEMLKQFMD